MRAVHSKPPISGIWTSISTQPNPANAASSRIASASTPVVGDDDGVPAFLEQMRRHHLVDAVVLDEQNASRVARFPQGVARDERRPMLVQPPRRAMPRGWRSRSSERSDRFGEVAGDAQLPAPGRIARFARGREHHDGRAGDRRIALDGGGQREPIRVGHLKIRQHEGEGLSRIPAPRGARRARRRAVAASEGRMRQPSEHLFEQAPVRGVVVDDQDRQVSQIDRIRNGRQRAGRRPPVRNVR